MLPACRVYACAVLRAPVLCCADIKEAFAEAAEALAEVCEDLDANRAASVAAAAAASV